MSSTIISTPSSIPSIKTHADWGMFLWPGFRRWPGISKILPLGGYMAIGLGVCVGRLGDP